MPKRALDRLWSNGQMKLDLPILPKLVKCSDSGREGPWLCSGWYGNLVPCRLTGWQEGWTMFANTRHSQNCDKAIPWIIYQSSINHQSIINQSSMNNKPINHQSVINQSSTINLSQIIHQSIINQLSINKSSFNH